MPNQTQRALARGCRFVVANPEHEQGLWPVSFHKTAETARRAAWRLARGSTERSEWPTLDEATVRDGWFSIGAERESIAQHGTIDAMLAERTALGLD